MAQQSPFEIIAWPYQAWVAPVGEAFPDLADSDPADGTQWELLGTSGSKNYGEDGVTVTHEQTVTEVMVAGLASARKAYRTAESVVVAVPLMDVSAAQYAKVLNDATVTDTAAGSGTAGNLEIPLEQGLTVATFALLIRGDQSPDASAADDDFYAQYELPIVYQNANPAPQYRKGEPAILACEFRALWDPTSGLGSYRTQDEAASA